jgi:hypothetical protein
VTPPATSSAGARTAPERKRLRRAPRPAALRRVSGPATGRVAPAPAQPRTRPERETAKPRIRPVRETAKPRTRPGTRSGAGLAIKTRGGAFVRSLPDHPLLDRLIRGRVWIPLLGVMLAGIVAMQVEVLKLGASMGRSLQMNSQLSARNASLHESVASLSDDQRIEQLASSMGMVMPPPQAVAFLRAHRGGDVGAAIANIHQPDAGAFEMLTTNHGAVVTASSLAAWNDFGTTAGSTATTAGSTATTADSTATTAGSTATTAGSTATTTDSTATTAGSTSATPATTTTTAGTSTGPTSTEPTTVAPTTVAPTSTSGTTLPGATPTPATSTAPTSYSTQPAATGASTGAVAAAPSTTSQGG